MTQQDIISSLFTEARTHRAFSARMVETDLLKQIYQTARFAPTASNLNPLRVSFVVSEAEKAKVIEAAAAGNKSKIESAPVVAIMAYDTEFYRYTSQLAPHMNADSFAAQSPEVLQKIAIENSWLQAGAFLIAARAHGLDCGPMSGFDNQAIDSSFYAEGSWRSLFLMNMGYGDTEQLYPRGDRLSFDDACALL